jgi:hypothetical protein
VYRKNKKSTLYLGSILGSFLNDESLEDFLTPSFVVEQFAGFFHELINKKQDSSSFKLKKNILIY